MKFAGRVKSISCLKANAPDVIRSVSERREAMVITRRGEAKAVLQDIESFERTPDAIALLKILALSNADLERSGSKPAAEAFAQIRARRR